MIEKLRVRISVLLRSHSLFHRCWSSLSWLVQPIGAAARSAGESETQEFATSGQDCPRLNTIQPQIALL